jgi:hypothetical protein
MEPGRRRIGLVGLAFLLLTLAQPIRAQSPGERGDWRFGITGGSTITTLSGDHVQITESRAGVLFGGFVAHSFGNHLSLAVEANLAQKKSRAVVTTGETLNLRMGVVEVPGIVTAHTHLGSALRIAAYGGVSVGWIAK